MAKWLDHTINFLTVPFYTRAINNNPPYAAQPTYSDMPRSFNRAATRLEVTDALGLASVYRCVSILATLCSSLDVIATRAIPAQPLVEQPAIVRRPNLYVPRRVFIYQTVSSLALMGEAFWWAKGRTSDVDTPLQLEVVHPSRVKVDINNGRPVYQIDSKDVPDYQVKHLKLMHIVGEPRGWGPIQAARNSISSALEIDDYAGNWYSRTEIPEGLLKSTEDISPDQAKKYSSMWSQARKENRTAVLGKNLSYEPYALKPEDAMWIQAQNLKTVHVAQMYGVPATILDVPSGDSATYSNQQDKVQTLLDFTLRNYLDEIEDAWGEFLPRGTSVRFLTDELLRLNERERAETDAILINTKLRSVDELRERDGLIPLKPSTPDETSGGLDVGIN
jgi:HK97 family phage portal protein